MKCIVLSGATVPFTDLVSVINKDLAAKLAKHNYTEIEVQYGYADSAFDRSIPHVTGFAFDPEIKTKVHESQLVITHAGSGSILDSVERGYGNAARKVIVVVNDKLMDNHQLELAQKLESLGCVYLCRSPAQLATDIEFALNREYSKLAEPNSLQPFIKTVLAKTY